MIVELGPLPYRTSIYIIDWCVKNNVDLEQANKLILKLSDRNFYQYEDVEWVLDIPDEYVTWLMLTLT